DADEFGQSSESSSVRNSPAAVRRERAVMKFRTTILQGGKTATGIEVPPEIVEGLGSGKRPAVRVTINGSTYRSTVAVMGGAFMIGVSAEVRAAGRGAGGGDHGGKQRTSHALSNT